MRPLLNRNIAEVKERGRYLKQKRYLHLKQASRQKKLVTCASEIFTLSV